MKKFWVYFLSCPDSLVTKWVGVTSRPKKRLSQHMECRGKDGRKSEWISSLKRCGKKPNMELVAVYDQLAPAEEAEEFLISQMQDGTLLNSFIGKKWTPEQRRRQSEFIKKNPFSEEAIQKMRETIRSKEYREKHNPRLMGYNEARKMKIQDQFGTVYESMHDAERKTGCKRPSIKAVLTGKHKQTKGFVFSRLLIVALVLFSHVCHAALPPTRAAGQSDTLSTTFDFQAPLSQVTKTSGTSGLIETGNYNLLKDPGFEGQNLVGWTIGGLSSATTLNVGLGKQALSFYTTGAAQTFTSDSITIPPAYYGQNGELACSVRHAGSAVGGNIGLNASAGTIDQKIELSQASGTYQYFKINFVFPTSGTISVVGTSGSPYGESFIDDCYLGLARNVAQCGLDTAPITWTPTGSWSTNTTYTGKWWRSGKFAFYDINISLSGAPDAVGLTINLPSGHVIDTSAMASSGANLTQLLNSSGGISDGGTKAASLMAYYNNTTSIVVVADNSLSNPGTVSNTVPITFANTDSINIKASVPIVGWTASQCVTPEQQRAPKVTTYLSGSGTHTWSNGVTYARVRMIGGGGGGGSSGTASWGAATGGGNTTFGDATASGGAAAGTVSGGLAAGGTGGSHTLGSITGMGWVGGGGGGATYGGGSYPGGGQGGASCVGGAPRTTNQNASPGPQSNNKGVGGSGAGISSVLGTAGAGGGAGGCIDGLLYNPSGTTSYAVGAAGTGGSAGTSGSAGGDGSNGFIEVTEYFGYTTAILANSVTTANQNGDRIIRANFNCDAASLVTDSNTSGLTIGNISSGTCSITWPSFGSGAVNCSVTNTNCSAPSGTRCFNTINAGPNTTGMSVACISDAGGACTVSDFQAICIGPR